MGQLLSPGVSVSEYATGLSVSTAGSSLAAYVGIFPKGEANKAVLVDSVSTLASLFGKPTNSMYADFFQAASFLKYSNTLNLTRVIDENGIDNTTEVSEVSAGAIGGSTGITVISDDAYFVNALLKIDGLIYTIISINVLDGDSELEISPALDGDVALGTMVYLATPSYNSTIEVEHGSGTTITSADLKPTLRVIANDEDYQYAESSIAFSNASNTKLKFTGKNPGEWSNGVQIAIANPTDFGVGETAFGSPVEDYFEYYPSVTNSEIGVLIKGVEGNVDAYLVSLDPSATNDNGKSMYIETVINKSNDNIYVKDNTSLTSVMTKLSGDEVSLVYGANGKPGKDEIVLAYEEVYSNREEIIIDIFISNELANVEVASFAASLGQTLAIAGARYEDVVGIKPSKAVSNLIDYCSSGDFNISNKYVAFYGNYIEVYDSYNDKYRWINISGAVAGLRAKTNSDIGHWGANFGLDIYGQLTGVKRIAFNTTQPQRDLLYKNNINPIVSFSGQGNAIIWGQKTMYRSPNIFNRVHARSLFNYLEHLFAASSKYIIGKPNDEVTRNIYRASVTPVLDSVMAKRGIETYVIDFPEVTDITNFEFVCYIKVVGIVETVQLKFVGVGNSISISEVIGTV